MFSALIHHTVQQPFPRQEKRRIRYLQTAVVKTAERLTESMLVL